MSFAELQKLGKREEVRRLQDRAYKPPPLPEESWFPRSAYEAPTSKPKCSTRAAAVASERENSPRDESPVTPFIDLVPVQTPTSHPPNSCRVSSRRTPNHGNPLSNQVNDSPNLSPSRNHGESNPDPTSPAALILVSPEANQSTIGQRKLVEPCFGCNQVGHWRDECPRSSCRRCCRMGTTERFCPDCNTNRQPGNGSVESR